MKNINNSLHSDINDCDPNPCRYDGECIDGIANYTCNCLNGTQGSNCEISKYMKWLLPIIFVNDF